MLVLKSTQILGDIKCNANSLVLTSIPPDDRDESGFVTVISAKKPANYSDIPTYVYPTDLFLRIGNLDNNKIGCAESIGYALAIMPDWVDVGGEIEEYEPEPYPDAEDVEIEFEMVASGYCYNECIDIPSEANIIGKHGKSVLRSNEIFVEYCDGSNSLFEDVLVYDLDPVSTVVTTDVDVSIGSSGSVSSSSNVVKSISVVSNKNNYIDLYIDLNGIISIDNLPNGLIYKNKHISGIPLKSGTYISTVNFDSNITDAESYTIRFNIPALERIM